MKLFFLGSETGKKCNKNFVNGFGLADVSLEASIKYSQQHYENLIKRLIFELRLIQVE